MEHIYSHDDTESFRVCITLLHNTEELTTEFQVFTVVWNRVSVLVIITHKCEARVCYHQKAARDSISHGKHLARGC